MFLFGKRLPYIVRKPLFGDRRRFGTVPDGNDSDWQEWQTRYMDFYASTQKGGVGKRINDAGYTVLKRVSLEGKTIFEIGPGSLPHLAFWQGKPKEYIAADISEKFLNSTEEVLRQNNLAPLQRVLMSRDTHLLPIPDASVDIVLSFYSLEHCTPLDGYLSEFKRILKPGGLLVGAVPNEGGFAWGLGRFLTSRRWIHRHTDIDYDKIICWEHPNFIDTIFESLERHFVRRYRSMYPFAWCNLADMNLVTKFMYQKQG